MRRTDMKVVPLAQLYEQKNDYNAHLRKLARIKSEGAKARQRSASYQNYQKQEQVRMNLQKFERRLFDRRLELAKANQRFVNKLEQVKGNLDFRSKTHKINKSSDLTGSRSSNKEVAAFRMKENERIRLKVKSMSSQLSKGNLLKDYDRSMQIKNRLMRYQTEHNNRIVLKAGKILNNSQQRSSVISARLSNNKEKLPLVPPKARSGPVVDKRIQSLFSSSPSRRKQQIQSKLQLKSHKYKQMKEKFDRIECGVKNYRNSPTFCTEVK